tara:strand:+ start:620 stop:826 length:207 start_codon:yes stop_codon:yes gene_type:complete
MPVINNKEVQLAWGNCYPDDEISLDYNDYEVLIDLVFDVIKQDYINDEKCRLNSKLLGKLLILANKDE